MDNCFWNEQERRILSALLLAQGDTEAVARSLKIHEDNAIRLLNRSKSEVRMAGKRLEYEDSFQRERRPAPNFKRMPLPLNDERKVWFIGPTDWLCYLFGMDRRRSP